MNKRRTRILKALNDGEAAPPPAAPASGRGPEGGGKPPEGEGQGALRVAPQGVWRYAAYLFSFKPSVGLTLGILFATSSDPRSRRFGYACLACALVGALATLAVGLAHRSDLFEGGANWMIERYH